MIDFTKPIETMPCELNPTPVPCEVTRHDDETAHVTIKGDWFDGDFNAGTPCARAYWLVRATDGEFASLNGKVRNVEHG